MNKTIRSGALALVFALAVGGCADKASFTPAQQTRLQGVFPDGVCNYAVPGVEQQGLKGTWLTF